MSNPNKKQNLPGNFPVPRNSNQQQTNNSRFGGASSSNRFGSSNSSSRFGTTSRFGSSSSRFGAREEIQWTVTPSKKTAVRISLRGLGDPLHRLLGTSLNPELSNPEKVTEMLSKDTELTEKLAETLDAAWETYELRGAALLYPWDENIRKAFTGEIHPTLPPPPKKEENNTDEEHEDDDYYDDANELDWLENAANANKRIQSLRAIDVAFVMNVLARSRANVLVGNTPLALEPGFLEKMVICDDPRVVKIAQATGCIDEDW